MSMDIETQYCQTISSSQLDLLIQWNPNQNLRKLYCGYWYTHPKVHMKRQKAHHSLYNIEGKEWSWETDTADSLRWMMLDSWSLKKKI